MPELYVEGTWRTAADGGRRDVIRPADGTVESGVGRELRPAGMAEYQETKHIWQNARPRPQHWFG